ncbi:HD-GYP domain-containing protein [Thermodesulfatator atlanticus]|uniref:HD-GYP domain-containing protein n=1 Tax=Thermodesulfatator atlanticus TaxID=501497 RepID=UPI0003B7B84F|nr:HD-GYP domain-containing protein [Thermodesulfatator atlanticus]
MPSRQGMLILKDFPIEKTDEIATFLSQYTKGNGTSVEHIKKVLLKKPLILKKNIPEEAAKPFLDFLSSMGAEVQFIPLEQGPETFAKLSKPAQPQETSHFSEQKIGTDPGAFQGSLPVNEDAEREKVLNQQDRFSSDKPKDVSDFSLHDHEYDEEKLLQEYWYEEKNKKKFSFHNLKNIIQEEIYRVNKELWLILSLVSLIALTNFLVDSQKLLLSLYTLPTVFSAYFFGKRHAVLTAFASILLVILLIYYLPQLIEGKSILSLNSNNWRELAIWGGSLIITAYAMGSLYDRYKEKIRELQKTYHGVLLILRHFISKDEYTENHCYRVSVFAVKIAQYLGLPEERIEDLRNAALLHDIGKLKISREILYKAAKLTQQEFKEIKKHVTSATEILDPLQGTLGRIIPIILAHHEKYDGSGYLGMKGEDIPLEAKILAVADVYDALISDRPYKKGLPPFEAKEIIVKGAGKHFDPKVVAAFVKAFEHGEMEVPHIVV